MTSAEPSAWEPLVVEFSTSFEDPGTLPKTLGLQEHSMRPQLEVLYSAVNSQYGVDFSRVVIVLSPPYGRKKIHGIPS